MNPLKRLICMVAAVLFVAGCAGGGGAAAGVMGAARVVEPEPLELPEYPLDLELKDTADNAVRAAEYFIELMNYAQSTGDVGPYEEVSAGGCTSCHGFIGAVEDIYAPGGFSVGNYLEVTSVTAHRTEDGLAWEVVADMDISDGFRHMPGESEGTVFVSAREIPGRRIGAYLQDGQWWMLIMARGKEEES